MQRLRAGGSPRACCAALLAAWQRVGGLRAADSGAAAARPAAALAAHAAALARRHASGVPAAGRDEDGAASARGSEESGSVQTIRRLHAALSPHAAVTVLAVQQARAARPRRRACAARVC
jgi:hypothetical protein